VRSTLHVGSGQVTHISALARGLEKAGHRVVVFSREAETTVDGVTVRELKFAGDRVPFFRNLVFPFKCLTHLREFDVVHTQYHPGIFVGNASKRLGRRHVFTYHGFAPVGIWRNPRQRVKMVDHRVGTFFGLRLGVDKIIAVSNYLKKELVNNYRIDAEKVKVVYNCIDVERFSPQVDGQGIRKKYGLGDAPVVLYLGRLAPYKGVHYLIRAAPHVLKEKPETKFLIAGSGRYDMLNLTKIAERLGVRDSIIFTGYVPDELVPNFYASCDIFCYPSLWEGFGLPVAEAGATCKPVVALRRCAIPEVVEDGATGLLVEPEPEEVAEALLTLLDDENLRREMGKRARDRVKRLFSWREMTGRTVKVYGEVLKK